MSRKPPNRGKCEILVSKDKYVVGTSDPWIVLGNILEKYGYPRPKYATKAAVTHLNNIIEIINKLERLNALDILKEENDA